ncbi:MAG: hypothetical protein GXY50_06605 [Syntrophomonadaceae bacterium]|nr:hypothetical protein [Syntrophomonadaceae bacterium]
MEGIKRQAVVLSLVESLKEHGSWCGETHIQKSFFFLQELLKVPTNFDFIFYKHGPFSFDLRDELSIMRANTTLEFSAKPYPYKPSYTPGAASGKLKEVHKKSAEEFRGSIEFIAKEFSGKGVAELERLATALYVTLENEKCKDTAERGKLVHELKPHIAIEQAVESIKKVDDLTKRAKDERLIH